MAAGPCVGRVARGVRFPHRGRAVGGRGRGAVALADHSARGARPGLETITLWFVENDGLVAVDRRLPSPVDVAAAIAVLASGVGEPASGLRSALPSAEMVVGAEFAAGTASVELAEDFLDIPSSDQVLALGQIVYTLTDLRGVGRVRFIIEGAPVVVPLPGGDSTEDSVSRDDFTDLLSP